MRAHGWNGNQGFTVNQAVQTISFNSPGSVLYGAQPFTLGATSTSGLSVALTSTTNGVCTVSGQTVGIVGGGTCSLTASQAGNTNYLAASSVTQSFTVSQASQTITFNEPGGAQLSSGTVTLTATSTSGLAVGFGSNSAVVCTVSGSTVTLVAVGSCSITASQAGNASYLSGAPVTQSFNVINSYPHSQTPASDTVSISGNYGTVEIPQNVTVPFIFTYHDDNGASEVWYAQFALVDSAGNYLCEGDWGQPNVLDLYNSTGETYDFGQNQTYASCTVSLVSLAPSSTDRTAMVVGLNFTFGSGFAGTYSVATQVNYVDGTPPTGWEDLGTVIIDPTPGVTLTDSTTGATLTASATGTTLTSGGFFAGDSFTLMVNGLAYQPVINVLDGFNYGQVGTTNVSGQWTSPGPGHWSLFSVGPHTETLSVGDAPLTITFQVNQPVSFSGWTSPGEPVVTSGSTITVTVPILVNGAAVSSALSFGESCSDSSGDSFAPSNELVGSGQVYYISSLMYAPVGIPAGPYSCVIAAVYASLTVTFQLQVTVAQAALIDQGQQNITGQQQTVIVGQQIVLDGVVTGGPFANPNWTFNGGTPVAGFNVTINTNANPPVNTGSTTALNTTSQDLTFYFTTAGTVTVTFSVTGSAGSGLSASTTFNVVAPTVIASPPLSSGLGPSGILLDSSSASGPGIFALHYGGGTGTNGMRFADTLSPTIPAPYSGSYEWIQLAIYANVYVTNNDGVPNSSNSYFCSGGVDSPSSDAYVYSTLSNPYDAPSTPVLPGNQEYNLYESFQMFLLFQPNIENSIYVPLAVIPWSWVADIISTDGGNTWSFASGSAAPTGGSSGQAPTTSPPSYGYPNWAKACTGSLSDQF